VDKDSRRSQSHGRRRLALSLAGLLIGLLVAKSVVARVLAWEYYAEAVLIDAPESMPEPINGNPVRVLPRVIRTPAFFQKLMAIPDLAQAYQEDGKLLPLDQAYKIYTRDLQIIAPPKRNLLKVGVYHLDAAVAAEVANGIATIYAVVNNMEDRRIKSLESLVAEQEPGVLKAKSEMERLSREYNIFDPDPESPSAPINGLALDDPAAANRYLAAKKTYLESKKLLEHLRIELAETPEFYRENPSLDTQIVQRAAVPVSKPPLRLRRLWRLLRHAWNIGLPM